MELPKIIEELSGSYGEKRQQIVRKLQGVWYVVTQMSHFVTFLATRPAFWV